MQFIKRKIEHDEFMDISRLITHSDGPFNYSHSNRQIRVIEILEYFVRTDFQTFSIIFCPSAGYKSFSSAREIIFNHFRDLTARFTTFFVFVTIFEIDFHNDGSISSRKIRYRSRIDSELIELFSRDLLLISTNFAEQRSNDHRLISKWFLEKVSNSSDRLDRRISMNVFLLKFLELFLVRSGSKEKIVELENLVKLNDQKICFHAWMFVSINKMAAFRGNRFL